MERRHGFHDHHSSLDCSHRSFSYLPLRQRSNRLKARRRFKEKRYGWLVVLLEQAYVGKSASVETKKLFYAEYYKSWLYCSSQVIEAMNKFRRLFEGKQGDINPMLANPRIEQLVRAMREDSGTAHSLKSGDVYYSHFDE